MEPLEDLRKDIAEGRAVVVVGAGVSVQATGRAESASWTGLLHNGARHCAELNPALKEKWLGKVEADIDSDDLDDLLAAAQKITAKLGGRAGGEYRGWLNESVGELKLTSRGVIEAIRDLGVAVATTNYDGLIEEVTGLDPVTWRDHARVESVLQGRERAVLHLHGYYRDPESVVLGIGSYEDTVKDEHAQTVLRALSLMKTLVFVGCGAGLRDPNFGRLLQWREKLMSGSESRSYRLARDSERDALQKEHPPEQRILVLGYGKEHGDLEAFLRGLAPTSAKATAPVAAASAPGLPAPRVYFGRETEVQELVSNLLASPPLPFPVLGTAGIGKSAITIAALHHPEVVKRYGARRYFVRCEAAQSRFALAVAIARQLGIDPSPTVEAALLARLAEATALLVLDNLETPWEAEQSEVEDLLGRLAAVPTVALVASVRGNERPGGVTWVEALRPNPLSPVAARQAFLNITGRKFEADPRLDSLLNEVDRVPLPVTLLAFVAQPDPTLDGVWQRWQEERTAMLRRGPGADRLTNLELSYEISLKSPRMTEDARRLLSVLALLPNGVAAAHLASIIPAGGLGAATALRGTGMAYDESGRLRLLATIREYVRRRHPAVLQDLDKAARHYRELIRQHGNRLGTAGGADAARILTPEAANIEGVFLRNSGPAAADELVDAAVAWAQFARFTGVGSTKLLEEVAALAQAGTNAFALARCLNAIGDVYLSRSGHEEARRRYEEALALYRQVGSVPGEANCIFWLGDIAQARSDHVEARGRYEEALPLYRQVGSVLGEANCIQRLGDIAGERLGYVEARRRYEEALPLYRQVGSVLGGANCIWRLGDIALRQSELEEARRRYDEALPLYRQVGTAMGEANCLFGLGRTALKRSDHGEARRRYEEALPLYQQVGMVLGEANCIQGLGDIALRQSEREEARRQYQESLRMYERIEHPYSIGATHQLLARIATTDEDRARHVQAAREAWLKIDRPDLIKELDDEFGGPSAPAR